jgi:UDP-glucose 4-epimerase
VNKYLITGGTGFLGRRLVKLLSTFQCNIVLISRKMNPEFETVVCNLGVDKIPSSALESIDTVFHLAGVTHDLDNTSSIEENYYAVNVNATIDLAQAAADSGVKFFVFVSSSKAGGGSLSGKCANEIDQTEPEGIYGKTKREAELKLLEIGRKSDMHVSIIRPALIYGPDMKGNLSLMLLSIKKGLFPPLPETGNRRSMIHVDDVVEAILLIAEDYRAKGEIFIATDGEHYSSRDIYKSMCKILGKPIPNWSVPKNLFYMLAKINPQIKYKVDKLLGDQCYSSKKLKSLGFVAKRRLKEMNETSF